MMSQAFRIIELDKAHATQQAYVLSRPDHGTLSGTARLDLLPTEIASPSKLSYSTRWRFRVLTLLQVHVFPLFLPVGYPNSVTSDYTSYQIYDSLQAFVSSIAGLLSSRAVLQSLGVDAASSSSTTATYATLLSVAQQTVSNLSSILFANYASSRISTEVKFYRYLADIVNDAAFLLDTLSPSLPRSVYIRAAVLCTSSALRAVCGVAGGSSKAVLSQHFAQGGDVGELNAKDGSQEVLIGLLGMWAGGYVVTKVEAATAVWGWMLTLLGLHLWFNYQAVRSVKLRSLNGVRAGMIMEELVTKGTCRSYAEVGVREGVFQRAHLSTQNGRGCGRCLMGVKLKDFLKALGGTEQPRSGSLTVANNLLASLMRVFHDQRYWLCFDFDDRTAYVMLKDDATKEDEIRAWIHAARVLAASTSVNEDEKTDTPMALIAQELVVMESSWPATRNVLLESGWELDSSAFLSGTGTRFTIG